MTHNSIPIYGRPLLYLVAFFLSQFRASAEQHLPERLIVVDNVCAWPKLLPLDDGAVAAIIHNKPSHGLVEAGQETWISEDGGRFWHRGGMAARPDPGTVRMGTAVGLGHDGSLLVLASGWDQVQRDPRERPMLQPIVCRSRDGGKTWRQSPATVRYPPGVQVMRPWGNIVQLSGDRLAAPFYYAARRAPDNPTGPRGGTSFLLFSGDGGTTWKDAAVIGPDQYNETAILRLRSNRWLAAARSWRSANLDLFVSNDEGKSWEFGGPLTRPREHPGHLLQLADNRILLSYGIRRRDLYGVGVRISADEGHSWQEPIVLLELKGSTDGGYPSTLQLPDGTLVTAFYSNGVTSHQRYHMGVYRWSVDQLVK